MTFRTREEIEEEFFGGAEDIHVYRQIFNHEPIFPNDKEEHFMEVLLDIRELLQQPPIEISGEMIKPITL